MKDKKDKLQQELAWFRDFGYKVNELSSSVNNKACKYADEIQKTK
jgi:hypothetical protein